MAVSTNAVRTHAIPRNHASTPAPAARMTRPGPAMRYFHQLAVNVVSCTGSAGVSMQLPGNGLVVPVVFDSPYHVTLLTVLTHLPGENVGRGCSGTPRPYGGSCFAASFITLLLVARQRHDIASP